MAISQEMTQAVKPQVDRLKALNQGLKVGKVLGERVLIKTIIPATELDRIEKEGTLVIPKHLKKEYTPLPSTGIIVVVGEGLAGSTDPQWKLLQEGTMVMFGRFAGVEFTIEEEGFRIVHATEIMCTLEESSIEGVVAVKEEN